jgi:glutamyl-tRNA reductase
VSGEQTADRDVTLRRLRRRAHGIRDREKREAIERLAAADALDESSRDAVEQVADALTARLLTVPASALDTAGDERDERMRVALDLFA